MSKLLKNIVIITVVIIIISGLSLPASAVAYTVSLDDQVVYLIEGQTVVSSAFSEYGVVTLESNCGAAFDTKVVIVNVTSKGLEITARAPGETSIWVSIINQETGQQYMGTIRVYVDYKLCPCNYMKDTFPLGHWSHSGIDWAISEGITKGTSSNTFSPNKSCTRAQVVTFLWRAAGSPKVSSFQNPFKDVPRTAYYYSAVQWAVSAGITSGTSSNTFSPNQGCTRAQVVTFLWRYYGMPRASSTYISSFLDVYKNNYYFSAVNWASSKRITTGTSPEMFSPDDICTRAQVVTFLYRANNII